MNDKQENYLSMAFTVRTFLERNSAVWNSTWGFSTVYTEIKDLIDTIEIVRVDQEIDIGGVTIDKADRRIILANLLEPIAGALRSFALAGGDDALYQECNITRSDILYVRDSIAISNAQLIYDRANANLVTLTANYGITAGMMTAFSDAIDDYVEWVQKPRDAIVQKKVKTTELKGLFDNLKDKFKILDNAALTFKNSNLGFFNGYKGAREIIDLGGRKLPLPVPVEG